MKKKKLRGCIFSTHSIVLFVLWAWASWLFYLASSLRRYNRVEDESIVDQIFHKYTLGTCVISIAMSNATWVPEAIRTDGHWKGGEMIGIYILAVTRLEFVTLKLQSKALNHCVNQVLHIRLHFS